MKCAAIDIGTNSCRLLICDRFGDNLLKIRQQLETTRIGGEKTKAGNLNPQAIHRTCTCLAEFRQEMDKYEVSRYRAVATSAVREAGNAQEFVSRVWQESGIKVEIISGEEEARLSYLGVKEGLDLKIEPLVADLGGGSCEFIFGGGEYLTSIEIGAVRATELNMSAYDIVNKLEPVRAEKELFKGYPLVMVGGTVTTLTAIKLGLHEYCSQLVHGQVLTRREVADIYNLLERMPLPIRRRLPGLQPERADIIVKGALIVLLMMDLLGKTEITVSESDLMEGIIREL